MLSSIFPLCAVPFIAGASFASVHLRGQVGHLGTSAYAGEDGSVVGRMKRDHPYYHTTAELDDEIHRLEKTCRASMEVTRETQGEVSLTVVRVGNSEGYVNSTAVNRAFLLFGEHSRELIGPESGLHFLKQVCGDAELQKGHDHDKLLATSEIMLVLNANPRSRTRVEGGDFCIRTNPEGVDLNRNWDEKFAGQSAGQTNPGPRPFSEPETQIIKRLVESFEPVTFMTIHSGTRGMYMPWAYDMEHLAQRNGPSMRRILQEVDANRCECPFGAAGREVGYSCPGTCLDWVYDKLQTPYAFAYEIYTGHSPVVGAEDELKFRFEQQVRSGETQDNTEDVAGASFLQTLADAHALADMSENESPEACFALFNPDTKERYINAIENWASAYAETLSLVTKDITTMSHNNISDENE